MLIIAIAALTYLYWFKECPVCEVTKCPVCLTRDCPVCETRKCPVVVQNVSFTH